MVKAINIINNKIDELNKEEKNIKQNYSNAKDFVSKELSFERMRKLSYAKFCLIEIREDLENEYGKEEVIERKATS